MERDRTDSAGGGGGGVERVTATRKKSTTLCKLVLGVPVWEWLEKGFDGEEGKGGRGWIIFQQLVSSPPVTVQIPLVHSAR